jgi:hypothetical protein
MINSEMRIRCRLINALTGAPDVDWTPWKKNLVLDQALNSYANKSGGAGATNPATSFTNCQVGTSAAANVFPSGAITFTQTTTLITASSSFFTAGMVGAIIKFGNPGTSNGAEQYIVSQTGLTATVSGAGMTQTTTAGTVFLVQQTALVTPLLTTAVYQTTGSSCGTTYSGGIITHQRTFNFPVQGSSYNANEIGWYSTVGTTFTFGRLVLASTIVVGTTQFLQVQLQLVQTFSPAAPAAVANVGTGLNTAGNAMVENLLTATVASSGGTVTGANTLDGNVGTNLIFLALRFATYTQNASSANGTPTTPSWATNALINSTFQQWVYTAASVGVCTVSFSTQTFSTTGQTLFGLAIMNASGGTVPIFDIKLTTTPTLPTGTYQPQCVFTLTYSRTLVC